MSLILDLPIEIVSQLFGDWLLVPDLSRLESALGSIECRLHLLSVFGRTVVNCSTKGSAGYFEKQMEWMIARSIKVSSFSLKSTLPTSASMRVTVLLYNSKEHVKTLAVTANCSILESTIPWIGAQCCCLRRLELNYCNVNIRPLLLSAKNLAELILDHCQAFLPESFQNIQDMECPSINILSIRGYMTASVQVAIWNMCPNLTEFTRSYGSLAISQLKRPLTFLSLRICDLTNVDRLLATVSSVSKLSVLRCEESFQWISRLVRASSNYTSINIIGNRYFDISCFQAIGITPNCNYLRELQLASCPQLVTSALRFICTKCSGLEMLDISDNPVLREDACTIVIQCLPKLHTLKANRLCISDSSLRSIAQSALYVLEIYNTSGYTIQGLMALINGCNRLRKLCVNNNLVNPLVRELWKQKSPNLQFSSL